MPASNKILVYGTKWCPDCIRAVRFFKKQKVKFTWIDIDRKPKAAKKVKSINQGLRSVPTIVFPDGDILVEPSNTELQHKFDSLSLK